MVVIVVGISVVVVGENVVEITVVGIGGLVEIVVFVIGISVVVVS